MATTRSRPTEPERGTLEKVLDTFDELVLYRYPHVVGPPFIAGIGLGAAWAAHRYGAGWPWALTVVTAVVVFLGADSVPGLPGRRERAYGWACWLLGGVWTVAAGWYGPFEGQMPFVTWWAPPLFTTWLLLLLLAWPPWTRHRRIRRTVVVSHDIAAWDGDAVGLPGVSLSTSGARADTDSWSAPLVPEVKGSYTLEKLRKAIPNIAARYDVEQSAVTIDKSAGDKEGRYRMTVRRRPRPRGGSTYQIPDKRPTLRRPFRIGDLVRNRDEALMCEVWRKGHGGIDGVCAGSKGFGKSNYFRLMALRAVSAHDSLLFLGDMKPGSPDYREIGGLGAYVYAKTADQIDVMIRALMIICHVRGEHPRTDRKVLLVELDETALYFAPSRPADAGSGTPEGRAARAAAANTDLQRLSQFDQLLAISRAFDIAVHCATQRAREAKLGGDARAAMLAGQVCGFFSPKPADSALLSGDTTFDLTMLPRGNPGECLITNAIHEEVTRGIQHYVSPAVVTETLRSFGQGQQDLFPDELAALEEELGDEWRQLRAANRRRPRPVVVAPETPDADAAEPEAPLRRLNREESLQLVWEALAEFDKPVMAAAVAEACGKSERLVRIRLNELVEEKRAIQYGRGRWIKYDAVRATSGTAAASDLN